MKTAPSLRKRKKLPKATDLCSGLDAGTLHPLDGLGHSDASQIRIRPKPFPVPATLCVFPQGAGDRAKLDVDTSRLCFSAHELTPLANQVDVPCRSSLYTRSKGGGGLAEANSQGAIL